MDADGNDLCGVRYPDVQAPPATYLGWALRRAGCAEGELLSTNGCIVTPSRALKRSAKRRAIREDRGVVRRVVRACVEGIAFLQKREYSHKA